MIVEEYFTVFNEDKAAFYEMLIELEKLVSQHTKWNVPLFPARVVDPEKVHEPMNQLKIGSYLQEVYECLSTMGL